MKYNAKDVADALRENGGVVAAAARSLDCSRQTVYSYADRYVTVAEALTEARRSLVAEAENALVEMMRDPEHKDHFKATMKVLETYDPETDWTDRKRHEHATEGDGLRVVISEPNRADEGKAD